MEERLALELDPLVRWDAIAGRDVADDGGAGKPGMREAPGVDTPNPDAKFFALVLNAGEEGRPPRFDAQAQTALDGVRDFECRLEPGTLPKRCKGINQPDGDLIPAIGPCCALVTPDAVIVGRTAAHLPLASHP